MPVKKSPRGGGKAPEQYMHKKAKRLNNPHAGIATAKKELHGEKTKYKFDPHLDPQLQWTGKSESTEIEIEALPLHIHERIDPSTIIGKILDDTKQQTIMSFFDSEQNKLPLYRAVEFYRHENNWSNRLIAGDSLIVMNSLLKKEGMGGKIQMAYIDPPYGKNYTSNFQAFVCKQNAKDNDDELTQEAETILAFRDTWELEIHSYLTYLRDRIKLVQKMLTATGSCFVQISIENMHLVRNIMDEIFGSENFMSVISYRTRGALRSKHLPKVTDYIIWYAKDISQVKFRTLFTEKKYTAYDSIELETGKRRKMNVEEIKDHSKIPKNARIFRTVSLSPVGYNATSTFEVKLDGKTYRPGGRGSWKTNKAGMDTLIEKRRVMPKGNTLEYVYYYDDHPVQELTNIWLDSQGATNKKYVVQTSDKIIQRCMLMTTDPGDLVFDPTCGSGTTAFVAEKYGRRWITCDTSRIATTVAKQRIMTSTFEYYKLANNESSKNEIQNGFEYEQVSHITLKQVAQNEPGGTEILFDKPKVDKSKQRISGPFTVEAVPAPTVQSIDALYYEYMDNQRKNANDIGEESEAYNMQQQWREELLKTGIKGKNKQKIEFSVLDTHPATRYIHAVALTKETKPQHVAISFGPTHAPLNQRQVEIALDEARRIQPKISMIIFAAMHFDPEASKNIEKTNWEGVIILKAEMNKDLITSDLKKARSTNESFWLIGQPDVTLETKKETHIVKINGFDYFNIKTQKLEGSDTKKIVVWMLDTDYDSRSVYPQQLFFPMKNSTGSEGLQKLAKTLHGKIDEELLTKFLGTESLPFEAGENKRIAIKIVDDRGIESLKIIELE